MNTTVRCVFAILVALAMKSSAKSQQYVGPNYNNCIRLVNGGFGTIAIQNTCNISISVQWVPFGEGSGGQLDISPGSSQGTGSTAQEKNEAGGWDYYICPKNYAAVDGSDRPIRQPNTNFHCKKMF